MEWREISRIENNGKAICYASIEKMLLKPLGKSGTHMAHQSCPTLSQNDWVIIPVPSVIDYKLLQERCFFWPDNSLKLS